MLHEFVYFSNKKQVLFTEKSPTISARCLQSGKYRIKEQLFNYRYFPEYYWQWNYIHFQDYHSTTKPFQGKQFT